MRGLLNPSRGRSSSFETAMISFFYLNCHDTHERQVSSYNVELRSRPESAIVHRRFLPHVSASGKPIVGICIVGKEGWLNEVCPSFNCSMEAGAFSSLFAARFFVETSPAFDVLRLAAGDLFGHVGAVSH